LVLVSCHVLSRKFCFYFIMIDLMFLVFWFVFALNVNVSDLFATLKASSHTHTYMIHLRFDLWHALYMQMHFDLLI
jgi:hypothetical protein